MKVLPSKGMIIPVLILVVAGVFLINRIPQLKAKVG